MLLEREPELDRLDAALSAMRGGAGGVVLLQGPAGIGKTRLLRAAADRASGEGALLLRARGGDLERDFAFGVARQLFEPAVLELAPSERAGLLAGAAALAAPAIGLADDDAGATGDPRFAVTHGLYWLCANLAARQPLVIEVDDVHWADEPSLLWLAYLARRLADVPAILLLAARVEGRAPDDGPLAAIAAEPSTHRIDPRPLSVRAAHALIADATGVEPAAAVAAAVHERSAGNPFLLRELAVAIAQAELPPDDPATAERIAGVLPDTVARSVVQRLLRLSATAVALARATAVLGTDVQLVDAARLAELGDRAAADALDELVSAGLLLRGTPLRFVHPLTREAIYGEIPTGRRLYEHRRAADVLQARIAPERIAAHLLQCEPRADAESVAVLRQCGERAMRRGAPRAAARYLLRALEEEPGAAVRGVLLREAGTAEARLGAPEAVTHLEEAFALATDAAEIAAAASELAIALTVLGRMPEAVQRLEDGIAALEGRDRELELRLEGELGAIGQLALASTPRVAERLARVAPGLTGATPGERLVLASYAHLRSNDLAPADELSELGLRALSDGLLLQEQTADSPIFYLLMYVFFRADRSDLSEHWLAVALDEARARGSVLGTSSALAVRSQLRLLRGELADAASDAQTALDAQLESGWGAALPLAVAVRADCLVEQGEADAALRLFEQSGLDGVLPELQMFRWTQAARGRARLAAGHRDDGIADLLDCQRQDMGARPTIALLWRTDVAPALAAAGEQEEARRLAAEQVALARAANERRTLGVALRTLGLLTEDDDGLLLLTEAVDVLAASRAQLEHARALVELGARVRRAGQRGAARAPLRAGYELARTCGSSALADRAAEELAASGVRLRRAALSGRDALTPSERRVAEMAARGMNNPEIAQALFVTRKTVEMHLGRVYRKLGISGRDDLPTHLDAERPHPPPPGSAIAGAPG